LLSQYHWPGNVRQLRNVVTAAAVFAENREIQVADLPEGVRAALHSAPGSAPEFALGPRISDLEREAIFRALRQTGGRQAPAADMLGISRRTLIRKLKQYAPLQKAAAAPTEELVTCD
jgi:transcriptional regulator of acetoin/glycerol metabolism